MPTSTETLQENDPGAREEKGAVPTAAAAAARHCHRVGPGPGGGGAAMGPVRSSWVKSNLWHRKLRADELNKDTAQPGVKEAASASLCSPKGSGAPPFPLLGWVCFHRGALPLSNCASSSGKSACEEGSQ